MCELVSPLPPCEGFSGEVASVLAPSHGHAPLFRPRLPGALARGSQAQLPSVPRPQRSLWPHLEDVVSQTEVPLHVPGTRREPPPTPSTPPRPRSRERQVLIKEEDEEEEEMPFDVEAALAAARQERCQRTESTERGRPLGPGAPRDADAPNGPNGPDGLDGPDGRGRRSRSGHSEERQRELEAEAKAALDAKKSSREPSLERDAANAAFSRGMVQSKMLAALRPRPVPKLQLVGPPPLVEVEAGERRRAAEQHRAERRSPSLAERAQSLAQRRGESASPRKSVRRISERDIRAKQKIGKLLVAHYDIRRKEKSSGAMSRMLMRAILAVEEKNPEALSEGLALLQNAQSLVGGDARVALQALCLLDRKLGVRSELADAVRSLEELTKRQEKLLVDMKATAPDDAEDKEASAGSALSEELRKSWEDVHHEARAWAPQKPKEAVAVKAERLQNRPEAEKEAALAQASQALGTAVFRFAREQAEKEADELGEESLQRAAKIEYAIKAAEGQAVDPKHPDLLRARQIAYDLRALRAMRYCQHLMSTIEDSVGSAGRVATQIDQVIQDAAEIYGVPKEHPHMEEARRLVLKARTEEAKAKRRGA